MANRPQGRILEDLNHFITKRSKDKIIESRGNHVISSALFFLDLIEENFSQEESEYLQKKFINSIRVKDKSKFMNGLDKILESKKLNDKEGL